MAEGGEGFEIFSTFVSFGVEGAEAAEAEIQAVANLADSIEDVSLNFDVEGVGAIRSLGQSIGEILNNIPEDGIGISISTEGIEAARTLVSEFGADLANLSDEEARIVQQAGQVVEAFESQASALSQSIGENINQLAALGLPDDELNTYLDELASVAGSYESLIEVNQRLTTELETLSEARVDAVALDLDNLTKAELEALEAAERLALGFGNLERNEGLDFGLNTTADEFEQIEQITSRISNQLNELSSDGFDSDVVENYRDELEGAEDDYDSLISLNLRLTQVIRELRGTDVRPLTDSFDDLSDNVKEAQVSVSELQEEIDAVFESRNADELTFNPFEGFEPPEGVEFDSGPLEDFGDAAEDAGGKVGRIAALLQRAAITVGVFVAAFRTTRSVISSSTEEVEGLNRAEQEAINQQEKLLQLQQERLQGILELAQSDPSAGIAKLDEELVNAQGNFDNARKSAEELEQGIQAIVDRNNEIAGGIPILENFFAIFQGRDLADANEQLEKLTAKSEEAEAKRDQLAKAREETQDRLNKKEEARLKTVADQTRDLQIQLSIAQGNTEEAERLTDEKERQADIQNGLNSTEADAAASLRDQIEAQEELTKSQERFAREANALISQRAAIEGDDELIDQIERESDLQKGLTEEQANQLAIERDKLEAAKDREEREEQIQKLIKEQAEAAKDQIDSEREAGRDRRDREEDLADLIKERNELDNDNGAFDTTRAADAAAGVINSPVGSDEEKREEIERRIRDIREDGADAERELLEEAQNRERIEQEIADLRSRADQNEPDPPQAIEPLVRPDALGDIEGQIDVEPSNIDLTAPLDAQTAVLNTQLDAQTSMKTCLDQLLQVTERVASDVAENRAAVVALERRAADPTTGGGGIFSNC